MEEVVKKAEEYLLYAAVKCNAHYRAARLSSKYHKRYGVWAIIMNATVGTALFVSLAKRAEATANSLGRDASQESLYLLLIVTVVALAAAVLSSLQTFLGHAESAEQNRLAAVSYEQLRRRIDLFLLRYRSAQAEAREGALKDLEDIAKEFDETSRNSPPIADSLYDKARRELVT